MVVGHVGHVGHGGYGGYGGYGESCGSKWWVRWVMAVGRLGRADRRVGGGIHVPPLHGPIGIYRDGCALILSLTHVPPPHGPRLAPSITLSRTFSCSFLSFSFSLLSSLPAPLLLLLSRPLRCRRGRQEARPDTRGACRRHLAAGLRPQYKWAAKGPRWKRDNESPCLSSASMPVIPLSPFLLYLSLPLSLSPSLLSPSLTFTGTVGHGAGVHAGPPPPSLPFVLFCSCFARSLVRCTSCSGPSWS